MPDAEPGGGTTTTPPTPAAEPAATPPSPAEPTGPNPLQLAAQLAASEQVAHHRTVELAVARAAAASGLDPEPLLDSRSFLDRATSLDHRAGDFTQKLGELVRAAATSTRHGSQSMTAPTTPDTGTEPQKTDPQPTQQQTGQQAAQQPTQPDTGADGTDWKAEAEKWKALARKHEDRSKASQQELTEAQKQQADKTAQQDRILKLLAEKAGVQIDDGAAPDPDKLNADLAAARADARQRAVELAVYRSAGKAGADADALLDSRAFQKAVADLDPGADDFADKVTAAIGTVLEANPRYKLPEPAKQEPPKPTVAKSGAGDFSGTPGGNRQWTEEDVANATPAEVAKAMDDGLLVDLGFAAPKKKR